MCELQHAIRNSVQGKLGVGKESEVELSKIVESYKKLKEDFAMYKIEIENGNHKKVA